MTRGPFFSLVFSIFFSLSSWAIKQIEHFDPKQGLLTSSLPRQNHLSFLFHTNHHLPDLMALEMTYGRRSGEFWWEFFAQRLWGHLGDMATPSFPITPEEKERTHTLTILGFGLKESVKSMEDFFGPPTSIFMGAGLYYASLEHPSYASPFQGPGLRAQLGTSYPIDSSLHYSVKMTYDLAWIKEDPFLSSGRSLILSWFGAAFEVSFYF